MISYVLHWQRIRLVGRLGKLWSLGPLGRVLVRSLDGHFGFFKGNLWQSLIGIRVSDLGQLPLQILQCLSSSILQRLATGFSRELVTIHLQHVLNWLSQGIT